MFDCTFDCLRGIVIIITIIIFYTRGINDLSKLGEIAMTGKNSVKIIIIVVTAVIVIFDLLRGVSY